MKCTKYVNISLFADDCVIYLSGNNWDTVHRKIQRDFDFIIDWTFRNNSRIDSGDFCVNSLVFTFLLIFP